MNPRESRASDDYNIAQSMEKSLPLNPDDVAVDSNKWEIW